MEKVDQNYRQKTVVVLGPPRSGTSTTAGLLNILGVDMGNLRDATPENPKGLFEDKDFLSLIREIFIAADPTLKEWNGAVGWKPPSPEAVLSQRDRYKEKIKELISKRAAETKSSMWGWKVASTGMAVELFLPYLSNPHFVVVLRNPLDIAKSSVEYTKGKERLNLIESLRVSNSYYQGIFNFLSVHPTLPTMFISFEDMVNNPTREAKKLADFLGVEFTPEKAEEAINFVIPRDKIDMEKRKKRVKQSIWKSFRLLRNR
ncbi:MAG TPA: sulfotransferase domain-containing protein [Thermodesulfobacteriota bacterium]|nr:sulfotransferase domain-containing protein [Thermodesulfobacteriota bacterium]